MADLKDTIRLTTVADLQALTDLANEYKKLGLTISGVAGASRIVSEQIKRDALEQSNAIKLSTLSTQQATAEINKQSAELKKHNLELKAQSAALNDSKKSSDGLFGSLSSLTGLRSQLIGLFGAMSIGAFAKDIIDAQSQIQAFDLSMKNLLGEKYGTKLTEDLKQFTINTPLNFEEVIKASNQLVGSFKAAGISSKEIGIEIPKIMESLGNSAAALGGGDRLGRLVYAFSQVQATGKLMGTEVRQITETGFPLLAVMSQTTGKSVQELRKDIHDGKVSFEEFSKAILSAGKDGGVFAGSMDIRMGTVQGRLEKLGETFFFIKGRIGEFFNDSAVSAIDFGSKMLKVFLGTDEAIKNTIQTIELAVKTWIAYKVIMTSIDASKKASLVIDGLKILALEAETGAVLELSLAQKEARASAIAFSGVISNATPAILLTVAIGTLVAIYQKYSEEAEKAKQINYEWVKANDIQIRSVSDGNIQMRIATERVMGLKEGTELHKQALSDLIKQYPQYFGKLDIENTKNSQLKTIYDAVNKSIEMKISLMAREKIGEEATNRAIAARQKLIQGGVSVTTLAEYDKVAPNFDFSNARNTILEYQSALAALKTNEKQLSIDRARNFNADHEIAKKAYKDQQISYQEYLVQRENLMVKYHLKEEAATIKHEASKGKAEGDGNDNKIKKAVDSAKTLALIKEKANNDALEKTRITEQMSLRLERDIDIQRIIDAKASETKKNAEIFKIKEKYFAESSQLTNKWDDKEKKDQEKIDDEKLKLEKKANKELEDEAMENAKRMWKVIEDRINDEIKEEERSSKAIKKLKEDNQKIQIDITEKGYDIQDKLRVIDSLKHGASLKNIEKIEKDSASVRERNQLDAATERLRIETDALNVMKEKGLEGTEAYLIQLNRKDDANKDYLDKYNTYLKAEVAAEIEALKKREEVLRATVGIISSITDEVFSKMEKDIDESLSRTTDAVKKNRLEEIKTEVGLVKDFVSVAAKAATGDFAGAITQGAMLIFKTISYEMNRAAEFEKAVIERQEALLKKYAETAKETITSILSQINEVSDVYAKFKVNDIFVPKKINGEYLTQLQAEYYILQQQATKLIEIADTLGKRGSSLTELIAKETEYGAAISAYYDKVIKNEEDRYEKQVDGINKTKELAINAEETLNNEKVANINSNYEKEVDNINKLYSLKTTQLSQAYDAETIGILAAGSKQLEGLITNEASLSSVREEFAAKRLEIEEAFPLATKQITAEMNQAEVDAINASIKARDEALSKLQEFYNEELKFIITSEGQKRKEYTETEKITNEIRDNLYKASLKFAEDQIVIERDKQNELLNAALKKDADAEIQLGIHNANLEAINLAYKSNIEAAEITHTNNLVAINKKKDEDLLASFQRLTLGIETELNRVSGLLSSMKDKTSEEYKALQAELQKLIDKYKELTGLNPTITIITTPINPSPNNPRGFDKGTDNLSVSMSGKPTADSKGGWNIIAHPDEAIFSKAQMTDMTQFMGKRPTRDEVIERFKVGAKMIDSSSFIQKISPYVINKTDASQYMDMQGLRSDLKQLTKEVVKRQQPIVYLDKNGVRAYMTSINSQIEIKNQKFGR